MVFNAMVFNIVMGRNLESHNAPSEHAPPTASLEANFHLLSFFHFSIVFLNSTVSVPKFNFILCDVLYSQLFYCLKLQGWELPFEMTVVFIEKETWGVRIVWQTKLMLLFCLG